MQQGHEAKKTYSCNIGMLDPWLDDGGTNRVGNDDSVWVDSSDGVDEVVRIVPQGQIFTTKDEPRTFNHKTKIMSLTDHPHCHQQ